MTLATGIQAIAWAKIESTFDTALAEAATDAIDFVELKFEPELAFEPTQQHTGTGSLQDEIEGKRGGKWSGIFYVAPNAAGVAPDIGELLEHALGDETIVGGTSTTYGFIDSNPPSSLQLIKQSNSALYEIINGAWCEQLVIELSGGALPRFTLSGSFASYGWLYGGATVLGAQIATDTDIVLGSGQADLMGKNALIQFGSEDNGGAGYRVVSTTTATDTVTITPGLANGLSGSEAVTAVVQSSTLAGTVLGGIACDLSVDGSSIGFISDKITIATGIMGLDKEANTNRASRLVRQARRNITSEGQVYFDDSVNGKYIGGAWNGTTRALITRFGADTAASRMKVNRPKSRLEVAPIEVPDAEEATWAIKSIARQNAIAGDELTIVFD